MAGDLTPVSYIAGTAASIVVVAGAARSYYSRQRKRWTGEGARAQRNAEALEANTTAARANTDAISRLAEKLAGFADETRRELNDHHGRLTHLEDLAEGGIPARRTR